MHFVKLESSGRRFNTDERGFRGRLVEEKLGVQPSGTEERRTRREACPVSDLSACVVGVFDDLHFRRASETPSRNQLPL